MQEDLVTFLNAHASAVFGVVGALGGALMSFVAALLLGKRDYQLRAWERILDRRLTAHESVMTLARQMRLMTGTGAVDSENEVRRYPCILQSLEHFESWFTDFGSSALAATTWLNTSTKRELNLVQDYIVTLHVYLADVPNDKYPEVGELLRQDFIDLSASLEKSAFTYFERDIQKLRLGSLREHHKYKKAETLRRLQSTTLLANEQRIRSLAHVSSQPPNSAYMDSFRNKED